MGLLYQPGCLSGGREPKSPSTASPLRDGRKLFLGDLILGTPAMQVGLWAVFDDVCGLMSVFECPAAPAWPVVDDVSPA